MVRPRGKHEAHENALALQSTRSFSDEFERVMSVSRKPSSVMALVCDANV